MIKTYLIITSILVLSSFSFASACDYSNDPYLKSQKAMCNNASKEWICDLNRCMTKENAVDTRHQLQTCADLGDADKVKECINNLANEKSENPDIDYSKGVTENLASTAYGMSIGLVAISYLSEKSKSKCTSKTILTGASTAFVASEIYYYFFLKKELEKLRKDYADKEIADSTYNAQVDAFNYLKQEQELIRDIAKRKYQINLLLTTAYGSAGAMALYEMISPTATKCTSTTVVEKGASLYLSQLIFPLAYGADKHSYGDKKINDYLSVLLGAGATVLIGTQTKFGKYFTSSAGIAIISSLAGFMSYQLAEKHKEVEEQAKENIKKIQIALDEFTADAQQFCPAGRDDLSIPNCYCYNSDGTENTDRSASQTCQNLWHNKPIVATTDDYNNKSKLGSYGCVTKDQRFDSNCDCKQMINTTTGEDACLKTLPGNFNAGNLTSAIGLNGTSQKVNDLLSGNLKMANLNTGDLKQKGAQIKKVQKSLLRQFNKNKKSPFKLPNDMDNTNLLGQLASSKLLQKSSNGSLAQPLGQISPSLDTKNNILQKAINTARDEIGYSKTSKNSVNKSKSNNDLNFNYQSSRSARKSGKQLNFDKNKYQFGKQDINLDKHTSLWSILTNRYNVSALPKLFSDE